MCDDCFQTEFSSFPSENDWLEFDLELTKKLGANKMENVSFDHDGKRDKDDGQYLYKCLTCGQNWKLRDPDHADRGYFLKHESKLKVKWFLK
jgi:hypothetical protein